MPSKTNWALNDADSELADLEMETRPEDVLTEIDRVHRQVKG